MLGAFKFPYYYFQVEDVPLTDWFARGYLVRFKVADPKDEARHRFFFSFFFSPCLVFPCLIMHGTNVATLSENGRNRPRNESSALRRI